MGYPSLDLNYTRDMIKTILGLLKIDENKIAIDLLKKFEEEIDRVEEGE
jgi:hypothetical protein